MRVVLTHAPGTDVHELRQAVLGAGLDCAADDCVAWDDLSARLAQRDADLVIFKTGNNADGGWHAMQEAQTLTRAALVAVGPISNQEVIQSARRAGASDYVDDANVRVGLDTVMDRLTAARQAPRRGKVIAVFAPTAGSGGTTVSANLAGALARKHPNEVALVELAREFGDLALLLNIEPQYTLEHVCQRWRNLDRGSLASSFTQHPGGFHVLFNGVDQAENRFLDVAAARRIAVLTRTAFKYSVLALDSRLSPLELEAMRLSDEIALVVRPDVPAVRRAQWALAAAVEQGIPHGRFKLVLNRWGQRGQLSLKQIQSSLNLKALQFIPNDPKKVNKAANHGQLLHEVSSLGTISRRFAALASSLNGVLP
jgi:pilus assembly protein CpaE